ncbi:hypothetical protein [Salegentibacter holothuriorum]|uniref:hypothetical protein n=1 Tax=Salegentibacter holothuriorum TaxID=241145 RepID=UPI001590AAA5|nr:hypothetical protein [Salegentibacter holothuriorum]
MEESNERSIKERRQKGPKKIRNRKRVGKETAITAEPNKNPAANKKALYQPKDKNGNET